MTEADGWSAWSCAGHRTGKGYCTSTSETLAAQPESTFTASDTAKAWARPIHADLGFGLPGAVIVLLSGLSLPALYFTGALSVPGFLIWRTGRRSSRITSSAAKAAMSLS